MTARQPTTPSNASANASHAKPASKGKAAKGGVANRSGVAAARRLVVSEEAERLARLVVEQSREPEVAAVLGQDHLPAMLQRMMDDSLTGGPAAAQARGLLLRLMRHPAASAADRQDADRSRPLVLRHGLVGRLTDGPAGAIGHAGVTAQEPAAVKAPF